jgi:hypothetical protein
MVRRGDRAPDTGEHGPYSPPGPAQGRVAGSRRAVSMRKFAILKKLPIGNHASAR